MELPTDDEIRGLHERFAPSPEAFEQVWTHCRIVRDMAVALPAPGADPDLVRAGALLHDIGVYRLRPGEAYIRHGVLGHDLLRSLGLPEPLARVCSHHTGVGITRDDVREQRLPLPVEDYLDETPSETVIMYADKFHSKSQPPRFLTAASYTASVSRFGQAKVARFAGLVTTYGEPDVHGLARRYGHDVR